MLETIIKNADDISYLEEGTIVRTYQRSEFDTLERFVKDKFRTHIEFKIDGLIEDNEKR
jgi:hypothetical protein